MSQSRNLRRFTIMAQTIGGSIFDHSCCIHRYMLSSGTSTEIDIRKPSDRTFRCTRRSLYVALQRCCHLLSARSTIDRTDIVLGFHRAYSTAFKSRDASACRRYGWLMIEDKDLKRSHILCWPIIIERQINLAWITNFHYLIEV